MASWTKLWMMLDFVRQCEWKSECCLLLTTLWTTVWMIPAWVRQCRWKSEWYLLYTTVQILNIVCCWKPRESRTMSACPKYCLTTRLIFHFRSGTRSSLIITFPLSFRHKILFSSRQANPLCAELMTCNDPPYTSDPMPAAAYAFQSGPCGNFPRSVDFTRDLWGVDRQSITRHQVIFVGQDLICEAHKKKVWRVGQYQSWKAHEK